LYLQCSLKQKENESGQGWDNPRTVQSFLSSLAGELDWFFLSGEGERLRSHSAIKLDAVRVSFEGANLVIAGQGMPSDTLGSGTKSSCVARQSPKLIKSAHINHINHINQSDSEI
jgi:hypothetical protein